MTAYLYGVCPNCGKIVWKQETIQNSGSTDSISYRKGERCKGGCYGRRANQAPEKRREKK